MSAAEKLPEIPALSPSIAHVLDSESPRHAWTIHRLLGNRPKPQTDAQERGKLFHALLLEGDAAVEVIDAKNFQTNAAKEARDEARAAGKIPIIAEKYDGVRKTVERLRETILDYGYDLSDGTAEHRVEWTEGSEHGDVRCSSRLDWLSNDRTLIIDLKTGDGSAHPDVCAAKLLQQGGVIQDTAYRRAVEALEPRLAGRVEMVFLFACTGYPFDGIVTPVVCAGSMREIGAGRWSRAVEIWARCLARGREKKHWPPYVTGGPVRVEAPAWALAREIMEE